MNQDIQKQRKRTINFTVGTILAALHAAVSANSLRNNSTLEGVSDSALSASVVKAGMIAGGAGLIVTLAALVLIKRARFLPPVLMILVGNYLCPSLFLMIFRPLFFSAVDAHRVNSPRGADLSLILFQTVELNAWDCVSGYSRGCS
jgi:lysylphosphatidylglycerol synthetase-like protein (DUF2156 family)